MYQYWLFAFETAKHWGRGPQDWTASLLYFDKFRQRSIVSISSPSTPVASAGTPVSVTTPKMDMVDPTQAHVVQTPSALCRWSIHYRVERYERIPSPPLSPAANLDLNDERSWQSWPGFHGPNEYTQKLNDNLESNDFSNVKPGELPIAVDYIARAARSSPEELLQEAFGFSIMSRNLSLVLDFCEKYNGRLEVTGLYPFHLAVSYLDGSKTCCNILEELMSADPRSARKLYVNDLGHTVLDQLMIAILKAHSSCSPVVVDAILKRENRFEGEDVDICGRWDSDSECVRALLATGKSSIPFEWKHMFCHTSVQAICHCIATFFGAYWGPNIDTPSGLFMRRCLHCGLKLQLFPLHTLILVGLHLSQSGCKDETLFGILSCLLCLLSIGANPRLKANISVQALLDIEEGNECRHEDLDPLELAEKIPTGLKSMWSREISTGWQLICCVLQHSQTLTKEWKQGPYRHHSAINEQEHDDEFDLSIGHYESQMSTDEELGDYRYLPARCPVDFYHDNFFGKSRILSTLWAAVQTEFLTYRRLKEGDEWISNNFNMHTLDESLRLRNKVDIPLVRESMMKDYCSCGEFWIRFHKGTPGCAIVDDVAAYYFANLDDWNRATFIKMPNRRHYTWR